MSFTELLGDMKGKGKEKWYPHAPAVRRTKVIDRKKNNTPRVKDTLTDPKNM